MLGPAFAADPASGLPDGSAEEKRKILVLMRQNRQRFGDDAALMQGLLLMHSVQGDAVGTTEAAITGFEELDGRRYVAFHVASGVIFDDRTMDREARLQTIWRRIVERTLLKYPAFSVPGDGVAVEVEYSHRPYASLQELYRTIDDPGAPERAKFYLLAKDLTPFLRHEIAASELLGRSRVLLDAQPFEVHLVEPMGPFLPADSAGR